MHSAHHLILPHEKSNNTDSCSPEQNQGFLVEDDDDDDNNDGEFHLHPLLENPDFVLAYMNVSCLVLQ